MKVFPCDSNKRPLVSDWQNKATDDQAVIQQWHEQFRDRFAFFGIPTGKNNNLLVLDIDVKNGKNGLNFISENNLHLPNTAYQTTLTGGFHYLFRYPQTGNYGNKAGLFKPDSGLDTRGEGGYIIHYNIIGQDIVEAPEWLLKAYTVKPTEVRIETPYLPDSTDLLDRLNASVHAVLDAPEGTRNHTLNTQAYQIGKLVATGGIPYDFAWTQLHNAALKIGLTEEETIATLKSGLGAGRENPPTVPFPAQGPEIPENIIIPSVPKPSRWTPTFTTLEELTNRSHLKRPQLFKDWRSLDLCLTSADGGTGKSTLLLLEAICLALGEPFLGIPCLKQGRTLFITGEDSEPKLKAMVGQLCEALGILNDTDKVQRVLGNVLVKKDSDLCIVSRDLKTGFLTPNYQALETVMQAIDDLKPDLVVFDPIASFWGPEQQLNDMARAVVKFMVELQSRSDASIELVNHIGKASSQSKDETQFAGRGGTALPSHSRISKVMHRIDATEYQELTGEPLGENQSAIKITVNKFTDGSEFFMRPFVVLRDGFIFTRKSLTKRMSETVSNMSDHERILEFIKELRADNKLFTKKQIESHFMFDNNKISANRVGHSLTYLQSRDLIKIIDSPDATIEGKVLVLPDEF